MALIASMVLAAILGCKTLLVIPVWWAQAVVLIGGITSLFHYYCLKRVLSNIQQPRTLVSEGGLFCRIRHPMYTGDFVMYTGFWLMASSVYTVPVLLLAYLAIWRQAHVEDRYIERRFPTEFKLWSTRSGLLFPKLF